MRIFFLISAALTAALLVYALPMLIEVEMLRWRIEPWILRALSAEIPVCILLFALGFRWSALAVSSMAVMGEGFALVLRLGPEQNLVMIVNLIPAALSATAAMRIA